MESFPTTASPPTSYSPLLFTGIDVVDRTWGGFFRGGSYLLYGRATSGRDLLTLRFTQIGADAGESCLFISPQRPKDLMIQAASIGFDLRGAYEAGLVKLLRIPPAMAQQGQEDDGILRAIRDLVGLIREYRPQRLVINDFMPFVLFRSFDRLKAAITDLLEHTDVLDMTMVVVMSEPGNDPSRRIVEFIGSQMTGTLHLEMPEEGVESTERRLTLTPHIGHVRGVRSEPLELSGLLVPHGEGMPAPRIMPRLAAPAYTGYRADTDAPRTDGAVSDAPSVPAGATSEATSSVGGRPRQATELPRVPTFPAARPTMPSPVPTAGSPAPGIPVESDDAASFAETILNPYAEADAQARRPSDAVAPPPVARPLAVPPTAPPSIASPPVTAPPIPTPPLAGEREPFPEAVFDPYAPGGWNPPPSVAPSLSGDNAADTSFSDATVAEAPVMETPLSEATFPASSVADSFVAETTSPETPLPGASPASEGPTEVGTVVRDRSALHALLDEQYRALDHRVPFLVVAMRLDLGATPLGFDFMLDTVRAALRPTDTLYGDARTARLVAVLPESDADASGTFFTRLKTRLRDDAPHEAEALLRAIEAVVIPNGDPFPSADALLAYVLDTDA